MNDSLERSGENLYNYIKNIGKNGLKMALFLLLWIVFVLQLSSALSDYAPYSFIRGVVNWGWAALPSSPRSSYALRAKLRFFCLSRQDRRQPLLFLFSVENSLWFISYRAKERSLPTHLSECQCSYEKGRWGKEGQFKRKLALTKGLPAEW